MAACDSYPSPIRPEALPCLLTRPVCFGIVRLVGSLSRGGRHRTMLLLRKSPGALSDLGEGTGPRFANGFRQRMQRWLDDAVGMRTYVSLW